MKKSNIENHMPIDQSSRLFERTHHDDNEVKVRGDSSHDIF